MFWEEQLASILESGQLDEETIDDFSVAYAAETGDDCLIGGAAIFVIMLIVADIRPEGSNSENLAGSINESLSYSEGSGLLLEARSWSDSVTRSEECFRSFRESLSGHSYNQDSWTSTSCGREAQF